MSETPSLSGEEAAPESGRADRESARAPGRASGHETRRDSGPAATVLVNGAVIEWPQAGTVADLLVRLGMQGKRIAVSIDRNVIPRSRHDEATVRAGDRIEILEAVGGG